MFFINGNRRLLNLPKTLLCSSLLFSPLAVLLKLQTLMLHYLTRLWRRLHHMIRAMFTNMPAFGFVCWKKQIDPYRQTRQRQWETNFSNTIRKTLLSETT